MLPISHAQKKRQNWKVLESMLNGVDVHVKYAINTLNVVSLTARIAELKKLGFSIDWRWEITTHSRYKVYFIKDKATAQTLYQDILSGNNPQKRTKPTKSAKNKAKTKQRNHKTSNKPQGE